MVAVALVKHTVILNIHKMNKVLKEMEVIMVMETLIAEEENRQPEKYAKNLTFRR